MSRIEDDKAPADITTSLLLMMMFKVDIFLFREIIMYLQKTSIIFYPSLDANILKVASA